MALSKRSAQEARVLAKTYQNSVQNTNGETSTTIKLIKNSLFLSTEDQRL